MAIAITIAQTSFSGSTKASSKADRGTTVLITLLILRKKPFLILNDNKDKKKILYQNIVLPVQNLEGGGGTFAPLPDASYGPDVKVCTTKANVKILSGILWPAGSGTASKKEFSARLYYILKAEIFSDYTNIC